MQHWTGRNILERGEFVVNVPGAELAETVWRTCDLPHPRPVEAAGLTPAPSLKVRPPLVEECRAHLECVLDRHLTYGEELVVFGRIVAGSVDAVIRAEGDPYAYLRMFAFLEDGMYGVIERAQQLSQTSGDRVKVSTVAM